MKYLKIYVVFKHTLSFNPLHNVYKLCRHKQKNAWQHQHKHIIQSLNTNYHPHILIN